MLRVQFLIVVDCIQFPTNTTQRLVQTNVSSYVCVDVLDHIGRVSLKLRETHKFHFEAIYQRQNFLDWRRSEKEKDKKKERSRGGRQIEE